MAPRLVLPGSRALCFPSRFVQLFPERLKVRRRVCDVSLDPRELRLQPDGPRQAADGTRCLARMVTRRRDDGGWEAIDHATRRVERAEAPED